MSGIIGAIGTGARDRCSGDFIGSIDLLAGGHVKTSRADDAVIGAAAASARLIEARFQERDDLAVAIAGHAVADAGLDWEGLLDEFRREDFTGLTALSGRFAVALHDRVRQTFYLITDRLAQYPLFVASESGLLAFSTSQASFCRWFEQPVVSDAWFHEFFLANFSATHESFIAGVERLGAATVRRVSMADGQTRDWQYAAPYSPSPGSGSDRAEVERALSVFTDRVPRYLEADEHAVLGLTSGFDSRTILALLAGHPGLSGFTYGQNDCDDIFVGRQLAAALKMRYEAVPFDDGFEQRLGDLMVETVWLSGGLQSCARSTLLRAYRHVMQALPGTDVILSGVSGDQLFRGHGNVPSIVSAIMSILFETGRFPAELGDQCNEIFENPSAAQARLEVLRDRVEARYGDVTKTSAHIGYLTYEVPPEYFAGEACLADNFGDFRTPFCDRDVVDLAYSTHLSSLEFSRYGHGKHGNLEKNYLVANLINSDSRVAAVPIQRRPVNAFARGNRAGYFAASAWSRAVRMLKNEKILPHLEDWPKWFAGPMRERLAELLGPDARCVAYIRRPFIDRCLAESNAFWLNKIVTAEIVLRLVESRWQRAGSLKPD